MSLFTRLSATLVAGVDRTVSRIENHDAIVEASLREGRRAQAQARIRLRQVQRDGEKLKEREQTLETQIELWNERARATHDDDRARALECIRRRKLASTELDRVRELLKQHRKLDTDVRASLDHMGQRLQEMTQQRNQLRTRESAAQAQKVLTRIESSRDGTVDDTFERWEVSISENEIVNEFDPVGSDLDDFDAEFVAAEDRVELELELDQLLTESPDSDTGRESSQ
ncbi:MAG: PspA/IM30 family protein [Gammaproteobacteria bacterium]|nr:PspA/IM30 family protein [Gammaproteobacteria bacterium]